MGSRGVTERQETGQRDFRVQAVGLDLGLGENSACGPWEW